MALVNNPIQAFANVALLFAVQILIPAFLIITTPKYSWLRYFGIPCIAFPAYLIFQLAPTLSNSIFHNSFLACEGILVVAHCVNLLLILQDGGLTWSDLRRSGVAGEKSETPPDATFLRKLISAVRLVVSLRGVDTPWEAKNTPPHPSSLGPGGGSRASFLIRQGAILAWQYLFLDVLLEVTKQEPPENTDKFYRPGMEYEYLNLTAEERFIRAFMPFVSWFVVSRLLLDSTWRALSILFVASGLGSPQSWRPLFGSMWDAYTLRNFWGKFWHQILRWPFTSNVNFLTRRVVKLPVPSLLDRYTNNFLVFLLSGILHAVSANIMGLSAVESGSIPYFSSFALGMMLEDGVQAFYNRLHADKERKTGIWKKVVGFIWVVFWMSLTSPWYMFPSRRKVAGEAAWVLPFNLTEVIGMPMMWGLLGTFGMLVKWAFGTSL
uniref:Acetyltransferase atnC n=1 Tax=Arthrinium sp. TaxID=1756131 RepID=ATNC_ARTSZ|nr:RecName: Full=Acetyltransferase atnC; AltName: Full=Arthripenoid biosynthesis cluster protein C [Arthrinium sp.]AYO60876.1 O-acyl transferase AtnC [Arthrinium sp.]